MKKRLISILVISSIFLFPTIAQASTLHLGSKGKGVLNLQIKLNNVGDNVGRVDGIFGDRTKKGVIRFQASHGLMMDGIAGTVTNGSLTRDSIVNTAERYIGVPYVWGGSTSSGLDCSGLTSYVFAKNGITLPRVSGDQFNVGTGISFGNLRKGDLVFFSLTGNGAVSHVGIYIGGGRFINASSSRGVVIYPLGPYWRSVYVGARRVIQ